MNTAKGKCEYCGAENSKSISDKTVDWFKNRGEKKMYDWIRCWYCKTVVRVWLKII
jgi:hypothetical protein